MTLNIQTPSIRGALKKVLPYLLHAQEQNLNEADTVMRVVKVFEEVLGYDPMTEVSRECVVKGKFVDLAIKVGEAVKLLIEVKSAGAPLRDRYTDQARSYAAEGNIPWVVLTNGVAWNLYHLTFAEGIEHDLAFEVDLAKDDLDVAAEKLALLHHESLKKGLQEEYWRKKSALGAESLGRALFTDSAIRAIRREIRRAQGVFIEEEHLVNALKELFSVEARERIGPIKIRRRRRRKERVLAPEQPGGPKAAAPAAPAGPTAPPKETPPSKAA